jgi:regulator of protease activity HflC (stomatin/prohibitin superfamily)
MDPEKVGQGLARLVRSAGSGGGGASQGSQGSMGKGRFSLIVALLVLGAIAIFMSYYTVAEGYRGVVVRTGAVVGIADPGLGFKVPFLDNVYEMSVQTQRVQFDNLPTYSRDIQLSDNEVSVNYRLLPDQVERMYSEVGLDYANTIFYSRLAERFKEAYGRYSAADIVGKREQISAEIQAAIAKDMAPLGIVVEDVQIVNIDFSDSYEQAVEGAARAQAEVVRARQELERAKVEAQQQVAQAEAQAQAAKLRADGEAYAVRAKGEAEAAAIRARGLALKENPQLIGLIAAERWNGSLPTTMLPGSTMPFIQVPSSVP